MGSEKSSIMEGRKDRIKVKVLKDDLIVLMELGEQFMAVQRTIFKNRYESLLELLEVNVQVSAFSALSQYCDPRRCFTFCDFQLVSTFKEFSQILGMPTDKTIAYYHSKEALSMIALSNIIPAPVRELEDEFITLCGMKGFKSSYLEGHFRHLS